MSYPLVLEPPRSTHEESMMLAIAGLHTEEGRPDGRTSEHGIESQWCNR